MECTKYHKKIYLMVDSELDVAEESDVLDHISSCKSCFTFYKNAMHLKSYISDSFSAPKEQIDISSNIMNSIYKKKAEESNFESNNMNKPLKQSRIYKYAIAASLFAAVFSGILYQNHKRAVIAKNINNNNLEEFVLEHFEKSYKAETYKVSLASNK